MAEPRPQSAAVARHRRTSYLLRIGIGVLCAAVLGGVGTAATVYYRPTGSVGATGQDLARDERIDRAARGDARATPSVSASPSPTASASPVAPVPAQATTPAPATTTAKPVAPAVPAGCSSYTGNRRIGCSLLPTFGFSTAEMPALEKLWTHESNWNQYARNPSSGAYGIPQALPGTKMATAGSDWETNPATQIKWGLSYIKSRYGTPTRAWSFWQANNWY